MPNSTLIGAHQSLNSSKTEKLESSKKNKYWRWPKWLIRHGKKRQQADDAGGNSGQVLMEVASGQLAVVDRENAKEKSSRTGQLSNCYSCFNNFIPCFMFVLQVQVEAWM